MAVAFRALGPLEVLVGGTLAPLGGAKQRAVLAMLLLDMNRVVASDRLVDEIWPGTTSARSLQVYVSELRRALGDAARIRGDATGYRLVADPDEVDALRFEALLEEGRRLVLQRDPSSGASRLREALALWRGRPYENVPRVGSMDATVARLEELRLVAHELAIEAELALGRHRDLVVEIESLVMQEPLREGFRRQLMLALYRTGRQADALAAYHKARRTLDEELGVDPGPELAAVHVAILRQDPSLNVEPPEVAGRRHLPSVATPLVGREREVREVVELLTRDARLVTLTGPGGTGKTRIGLAAAHELAAHFAGGVFFVGLGPLRDPALVPAAIASALGLIDAVDPVTAIIEHLAERPALLLLDNFEQVDDAAPALGPLLTGGPATRLLVTSRHRLRVYGEHEYPISPLQIDSEAVPLFVARAAAVGRAISQDPNVRAVCERLDGLPLAIELAAARVGEIGLGRMLESLPRLAVAAEGPRDVPLRQQTMEAAIAWSHDLLASPLRDRFAALSVFAGGLSPEAAEPVADAGRGDLDELAARSLLRPVGDRFEVLETIREFAAARLEEAGTATGVRARHAAWYAMLAEEADLTFRRGGDSSAWLARLESEHDNFREALRWAMDADPDLALRMAMRLGYFWEWRGHSREGRQHLDRALERAPGGDAEIRILALLRTGAFRQMHGDFDEAEAAFAAALDLARATGHTSLSAKALRNLGMIAKDRSDYPRALALQEEARAICVAIEDPVGVLTSLVNLGDVSLAAGDIRAAREYAAESAAVSRTLQQEMDLAVSLLNLGLAELRLGAGDAARAAYSEALELCLRNGWGEGAAYAFLGTAVMLDATEPEAAARLVGAVDEQLRVADAILESTERPMYDALVERLRAALGPERLAALLAEGASQSLETTVAGVRRLYSEPWLGPAGAGPVGG